MRLACIVVLATNTAKLNSLGTKTITSIMCPIKYEKSALHVTMGELFAVTLVFL